MTSVDRAPKELSSIDRALIRSLITDGQTVVDISSTGTEWADAVLAGRKNIRALLYASPDGEDEARGRFGFHQLGDPVEPTGDASGLRLDKDAASERISHIHYLHIGDASMARPVLRGAQGLLNASRIDLIQMPLDTHDFLTGRALEMERHYALFEVDSDKRCEFRLTPYLSLNPDRERVTICVVAILERLISRISLFLLRAELQRSRNLFLPRPVHALP